MDLTNAAVDYANDLALSPDLTPEDRRRAVNHLRNCVTHIEALIGPPGE